MRLPCRPTAVLSDARYVPVGLLMGGVATRPTLPLLLTSVFLIALQPRWWLSEATIPMVDTGSGNPYGLRKPCRPRPIA